MGDNRRRGGALVPVLLALMVVVAAGAWNYHRNWTREKAAQKPRPYQSYSDAALAQLEQGYRTELEEFNKRHGNQSSRRVVVRDRGLIADQIAEFERVQQAARRSRRISGTAAELQVQLDLIGEERSLRAQQASGFLLHWKRLVRI